MGNIIISKILTLLLIVVFYFAAAKALVYLMPFILGWIISIIIEPMVNFFQKKLKLFRGLSSFISIIIFVAFGGMVITFIGGLIINELTKLTNRLPELSAELNNYVYYILNRFQAFYIDIPGEVTKTLSNSLSNFLNSLTKYIAVFATSTLNFLTAIPNLLLLILFSLISAFFISKDKKKIVRFIRAQIPSSILKSKNIRIIKDDLIFALLGYFKAQLILMSITFVESAVGLSIIGVNYSILIALVISVVDALPVLGSGSIYIPWIISKLIFNNFREALFLFIIYITITLVRQTLEPKILSTQIGLYPLVTLMSVYIGLKLFGFLGIILGPIIVITLIAFQKIGIFPKWKVYNNDINK